MASERAHFLRTIRQLGGNAVLVRLADNGSVVAEFVSDEFAAMVECDPTKAADLTGDALQHLIDPHDLPRVLDVLQSHDAADAHATLTVRMSTARGNDLWCNAHFAFVDDYDDRFAYVTFADVTQLKKSEARLHNNYVARRAGFYQTSASDLAAIRANLTRDEVEEVLGTDPYHTDSVSSPFSELVQSRCEHLPVPSERTRFRELFEREALLATHANGNTRLSLMCYSQRKDGLTCYVEISASLAVLPSSGDLIAFITERECNDDKVRHTLTRAVLARQFDMVCYLANGRYGVTIGHVAPDQRGSIFPASTSGDYMHYLRSQVFPVLAGTRNECLQMQQALALDTVEQKLALQDPYIVNIKIMQDGEAFYKQLSFYRVDEHARFYILLKSDTTQIQKQHLTLNEQLRIALDAANQANVAKTAFLSSMSHEIRTPMNAIIGIDKIALADDDLTPRTRSHLEQIGSSAQHLLELVNDVLAMSRIEGGRMSLATRSFSLVELVDGISELIGDQCAQKGLSYEAHVSTQVAASYEGDPGKLRQILVSMLDNAVKFTPAGGSVRMDVDVSGTYEDSTSLRFVISDTGIGMRPSFLPHVFDPFAQESGTNSTRYDSMGLGLALAKSMAELMQGEIGVTSVEGKGSTFTLDVMLGNARGADESGKESPDAGEEPSAQPMLADLEGRHILLAEDIPINAEIVEDILDMEGVTIEHAENGLLALRLFEESPVGHFDAVLMDLRMPVMDGYEATRAIRSCGKADARIVPIIALTANAFDEDVRKSLQAGMDAHLSKPVDADKLYETLRTFIAVRDQALEESGLVGEEGDAS